MTTTDDHATLLEPACACSLVPIYVPQILRSSLPHLVFPPLSLPESSISSLRLSEEEPTAVSPEAPIVVVIVCGGNAATLERLVEWEDKFVGMEMGAVRLFDGASGVDEVL